MVSFSSQGDFSKTRNFLNRLRRGDIYRDLNRFGQMGVHALERATPVDSGLTARSWEYRIVRGRNGPTVEWYNTNKVNGTPVAILIQYGHGTGTGGYVQGRDFINPTIKPIFDQIANDVWKKVKQ